MFQITTIPSGNVHAEIFAQFAQEQLTRNEGK